MTTDTLERSVVVGGEVLTEEVKAVHAPIHTLVSMEELPQDTESGFFNNAAGVIFDHPILASEAIAKAS